MTQVECPNCHHVSHYDRRGDRPCRVVGCECHHKNDSSPPVPKAGVVKKL